MATFDTRESFPLNRVAPGLADLLGAKTWPKNPHLMSAELAHVFDASDLYLFGARFGRLSTGSVTGPSDQTLITIPDFEAWYVEQVSLSVSAVIAGATLQIQAWTQETGTTSAGAAAFIREYGPASEVKAATFQCNVGWAPRRWYRPGTQFNLACPQGTGLGAGQTVSMTLAGARVTL